MEKSEFKEEDGRQSETTWTEEMKKEHNEK